MEQISKNLRKLALQLSHDCKDGNLQSVFSCLDIIWVLYDSIMNWSPQKALDDDRDFFLISKGQATLALFPVLITKGFFKREDFKDIGSFHSKYCIQTDITKIHGGVENAAGSLGHGFPMATGIALANKIKGLQSRTFVLTGDGEFMEGTMWESCLFAAGKRLDNLCVIIDDNGSAEAMLDVGDLGKKLDCFGFDVKTVDGHSIDALKQVLALHPCTGKPMAVIAKTVRGYGSKTMAENDIWFHKAPDDKELIKLMNEVDEF
jgi:transketolase